MRQSVAMLLFLLCLFSIREDVFAYIDTETNFKAWRATETCTAEEDFAISTVAVYLHDLTVTSGTAGIAQFQYINSSAAVSDTGARRSTSTVFDIDTTSTNPFPIGRTLNRGGRYRKTGTGCVQLRWEYSVDTPRGRELEGLLR